MTQDQHTAWRELQHRCANDLQMIEALLRLHARHAQSDETRDTLLQIGNRVRLLAEARSALVRPGMMTIEKLLHSLSGALQALAQPRGLEVSLEVEAPAQPLKEGTMVAVGIAVNELVTNAIKHAFSDQPSGTIRIRLAQHSPGWLAVTVDDDGEPLGEDALAGGPAYPGIGLDLARRTLAAQDCRLIMPEAGTKRFEIRVPVARGH